jgi:hypothetical protein
MGVHIYRSLLSPSGARNWSHVIRFGSMSLPQLSHQSSTLLDCQKCIIILCVNYIADVFFLLQLTLIPFHNFSSFLPLLWICWTAAIASFQNSSDVLLLNVLFLFYFYEFLLFFYWESYFLSGWLKDFLKCLFKWRSCNLLEIVLGRLVPCMG